MTIVMAVPVTSIHKNHGVVFRQNDVWAARQIPSVQPEPVPHAMDEAP